jgi:hypothetical protein
MRFAKTPAQPAVIPAGHCLGGRGQRNESVHRWQEPHLGLHLRDDLPFWVLQDPAFGTVRASRALFAIRLVVAGWRQTGLRQAVRVLVQPGPEPGFHALGQPQRLAPGVGDLDHADYLFWSGHAGAGQQSSRRGGRAEPILFGMAGRQHTAGLVARQQQALLARFPFNPRFLERSVGDHLKHLAFDCVQLVAFPQGKVGKEY